LRIGGYRFLKGAGSLEHVRHGIQAKLGRFKDRILDLDLLLQDEASPSGERYFLCSLAVHLDGGPSIQVERLAGDPLDAFDHALGVAERQVRKTLMGHGLPDLVLPIP
jgi:ribosome-associated translation inhibitor RaiA